MLPVRDLPGTSILQTAPLIILLAEYQPFQTFLQVQQVKKVDKFTCRMCQASQSVRKASMWNGMVGNNHSSA